ncbi:MAG: hypothetical protein KC800_12740 [Candidatus Eremiobacteraeota bacterium]|nr:hypothetical protein [Candidatus Eremiobacteraeota bacterium]
MEQDQQLKSLFERFDGCLEEKPPNFQDPRLSKPIHRFRSPWAKFLEWVLNGGAAMFTVFFLVSLSGIFWNGMSFGWVVVPIVIFLLRPLMGETPIKGPVRMLSVLLLGVALSMTLAVAVDYSIFTPGALKNPNLVCFLIENSLLALLTPDFGFAIAVTIAFVLILSRTVATRNPWLDRSVRLGAWRKWTSLFCLGLSAVLSGYILYHVEYKPAWYLVYKARMDPHMEMVSRGANIPEGRGGIDWSSPAPDTLHPRAEELVAKLRNQRNEITKADLSDATQLLLGEGRTSDDLLYVALWWELHRFAQDYSVGNEVPHLDDLVEEVPLRLFLLSDLTLEEMQFWKSRLSARPIRTFYSDNQELEKVLAVQAFLDVQGKLTEKRGTERFLSAVENRYFLQKYLLGSRLPSLYESAFFNSRNTAGSYRDFENDATHRFHADSKRSVLVGVLEARVYKAEHGEYPVKLASSLYGAEYRKTEQSAEFIRHTWDNKEELICRLPR